MSTIEKEFDSLKPWVTQFTINGKKYGGEISFDNDNRITQFFDAFPDIHSVLELGSLEGGHTFQLAKKPGISILGIEGRDYNVKKANFVKDLLKIENARFVCGDLEKTRLTSFGNFDAVFCSGILYHMPKPWNLISEISKITEKVFIWTHYAPDEKGTIQVNGYQGFWHKEFGFSGYKKPLKGLSKRSFWVTQSSLMDMLNNYGFSNSIVYDDSPDHVNGPAITLAAWKPTENPTF